MVNYGAKGYVVGKLEIANNEYLLTTNKGTYKADLTRDFKDYVDSAKLSIFDREYVWSVSPVTKDRTYNSATWGEEAHPPYLSFYINGINPKKPVDLDMFTIVGSCIFQSNPQYQKDTQVLKFEPFVLIALSPYNVYRNAKYSYKKRTPPKVKLIGQLPSLSGKPDALGSTFEIKCTYEDSKLYIDVDNKGNYKVNRLIFKDNWRLYEH